MDASDKRIPLWCDVDVGHDDCFALLLAAFDPDSALLGVSTVHGNASLANTTANTLSVLEAFGCQDVPVFAGFSKPLFRKPSHADGIHGLTGLDGTKLLPKPTREALYYPGDTFLDHIAQILWRQPPQASWVVATGALTNIHQLFTKFPDLIDHIKGLSIMGGAIGHGFTDAPMGMMTGDVETRYGNWTPYAEFNIFCDPEAAQGIFSRPSLAKKTTLITLDLTHKCLATRDIQQEMLRTRPGDVPSRAWVRQMMYDLLVFFADTYRNVFGLEAPPLHDPLAVLAAIRPHLFTDGRGSAFMVSVRTDGIQYDPNDAADELGRTIANISDTGGVRIPTDVDLERFWQSLSDALENAVSRNPRRA